MIKKIISKETTTCPKCGKPGILKKYDDGNAYCEHKRTKSTLKIMGQNVIDVEGCYIPAEDTMFGLPVKAYKDEEHARRMGVSETAIRNLLGANYRGPHGK